MGKQIGFVILSHANPPQTFRLIRLLQRMYDNPPIACHHDFGQSVASRHDFPPEVRLVLPHIATRWGHFSVIAAFLKGLSLLYDDVDEAPDWFVLLSGADYPTSKANKVIEELTTSGVDAFLDYREVPTDPLLSPLQHAGNPALENFSRLSSLADAKRRYLDFNGWLPTIRQGGRIGKRKVFLPFRSFLSPFGPNFRCFFGDHWFAGNRRSAAILLNPNVQHLRLRRYLFRRWSPEECYYATVFANMPELRIRQDTRRFAEWHEGSLHPETLDLKHLSAIVSSNAHFARKFAPDTPVLDEIDRMLI